MGAFYEFGYFWKPREGFMTKDKRPENASVWTKVVDPGVTWLGLKWNECTPDTVYTGGPCHVNSLAESSYMCNIFAYTATCGSESHTAIVGENVKPATRQSSLSPFPTFPGTTGEMDLIRPLCHLGIFSKSRN